MRHALAFLVALALLAGCTESTAKVAPTSGLSGPGGRFVGDNSTIHGKLTNSPHLNINSGMTLKWEFPNASRDKPGIGATLIQFLDTYKSSHHAFDGNFQTVAFIPVAMREVGGCGPQDKTVKSFLRGRDTGNQNRFGSLVGDYQEGWYHAILVTFEPASFTVSFDAEKEVKGRTLPAMDPYTVVGAAKVAGGRDVSHSAPSGEGPWFAWGNAIVTGSGTDLGRTHKLEVACQSGTFTRSPGQGNALQANNAFVTASAMGPSGGIDYKASYAPTAAPTASQTTELSAVWVFLKPIPLEAAPATGSSNPA